MRLKSNATTRAAARAERRYPSDAGPPLAVRAARASVARMRQAMNHAVARSPKTLFLRALVAQGMSPAAP